MKELKNNLIKDFKKYLTTSLQVYLFVLVFIVILKIVGINYFGLDLNNKIIIRIDKFLNKYHILNLWYLFSYYIYTGLIVNISSKKQFKKIIILGISCISLLILIFIKPYLNSLEITILDFIYLYVVILILNKFKYPFKLLGRYILVAILNIVFQVISVFIRNVGANDIYIENSILWILINLDYILLSIISHKIYFMKGGSDSWVVLISSSLKRINLKMLLRKLQVNYSNFKKQDKQYKATIIIYFIISLIWNILNVLLILFIASLNDTFIECIFIMTSFFITKKVFGKAFHLDSMAKCFIVSNLTYYTLNRITTPVGISILIPILLGVGLSYFTSKLVKKFYKPLYKGMPVELFDETILQVVDKGGRKYDICYDYFIKNKNAIVLSRKYNYSEAGIRKIINRVNYKIKKLNQ